MLSARLPFRPVAFAALLLASASLALGASAQPVQDDDAIPEEAPDEEAPERRSAPDRPERDELGTSEGLRRGTRANEAGGVEGERKPPQPVSEFVEELLLPEERTAQPDDLAWLYSDKDYDASELGGTAIHAPIFPERGEGAPRRWNPQWRRFEGIDYYITGTGLALSLAGALMPAPEPQTRRRLRNDFDEGVRDAIGIADYDSGLWARDASDLFLSVTVAFPLLIDSLIIMHWYRNSPDVAGEMALISAEAISVATALHGLTAGIIGRERPYVRNCGGDISEGLDDCQGRKPARSFFSGHTTLAFAGASASCTNHIYHDVFGDSMSDAMACVSMMGTAATVGAMRIVGDQHYLTDVLVGAAVGSLSGFGVPWLLHYGEPTRSSGEANQGVKWTLMPVGVGVGVGGRF